MRLTLRTLLAYLDDTLDANEIKGIGEKVAESDAAQELIARIKQVTRRRRLTTPPDKGPNAFDANDVAEYLDNELESDRVAEVEKQCLESDVHLAEIAACHQILTLVLGEPALVPPKAKERMYQLVTSRESIPFRKAAPTKKATADGLDEDEELALGGGWLRWVLPVAGILLVVALSFAVYSIMQTPTSPPLAGNNKDKDKSADLAKAKDGTPPVDPNKDRDTTKEKVASKDKGVPRDDKGVEKDRDKEKDRNGRPGDKDSTPKDNGRDPEKDRGKGEVERTRPPSTKRVPIGTYRGGLSDHPSVLVRRQADGGAWAGIEPKGEVYSTDTLTALPGFISLVEARKGVLLTLRGNVPAFSVHPFMNQLLESSVVLYQSDTFDLDLRLVRGRVYVRNLKEDRQPVKVRLRFENEVWDVTLKQRGDEIGFELVKEYNFQVNHLTDEPRARLIMCLIDGEGELKVDAFHTHRLEADPPQCMMLMWDSFSKSGAPQRVQQMPAAWNKGLPGLDQLEGPQKDEMKKTVAALKDLETALNTKRDKVNVAVKETLERERPESRVVAIFALGALDDADKLTEVLGNTDRAHYIDRGVAIFALRHWLAQAPGTFKRLYDKERSTGILVDARKLKPREAETITDLLFDFKPEDWLKVDTFEALVRCLHHRQTAIAELGMWHLARLSMGTKLPTGFNAALDHVDREPYAKKVNEMISKGLLPPRAGGPPDDRRPMEK